MLAYEFCVGKPPFEEKDDRKTKERILRRELFFPDHLSKQAADFITKCLQLKSENRPSFEQIYAHEWIENRSRELIY